MTPGPEKAEGEIISEDPLLDKQLPGAVIFIGFSFHETVEEPGPILKVVIEFSPEGGSDAVSLKVLYLGPSVPITTGTHEIELILDWVGLGEVCLCNRIKKRLPLFLSPILPSFIL